MTVESGGTTKGTGEGQGEAGHAHVVDSGVYMFQGFQNILNKWYQNRMKELEDIQSAAH